MGGAADLLVCNKFTGFLQCYILFIFFFKATTMYVDQNVSELLYEWINNKKRQDIFVQAYV